MAAMQGPEAAPDRVAVYRRTLPVPIARVWENVYDWEHLPWLHRESFGDIALEDSGAWGWRARVGAPPGAKPSSMRIELCVDRPASRYVTRTLEGVGAGTEIWTALRAEGPAQTAIEVGFHVHDPEGRDPQAIGHALTALYTRLWDQDEAMMVERERREQALREPLPAPVSLGSEPALRASLPKRVLWRGSAVWIFEERGALRAASLVCPHWNGPLAVDSADAGVLVCPWHGYRFDLRSKKSCDGHALRLGPAPQLVLEGDEVFLQSSARSQP